MQEFLNGLAVTYLKISSYVLTKPNFDLIIYSFFSDWFIHFSLLLFYVQLRNKINKKYVCKKTNYFHSIF